MNQAELNRLLEQVRAGTLSPKDAARRLQYEPVRDLGYAQVDLHRGIRQGVPEVIYGAGKTAAQIAGILEAMADCRNVLVTRLDRDKLDDIAARFPVERHDEAGIAVVYPQKIENPKGHIVIVSGGTSDAPVAAEAAVTARTLGNRVTLVQDVGVAGIHRLLAKLDLLADAKVIVAVAGMEGALPSVVAGLVSCPVIAVPTSVGYGASYGGVAALLAMLNSCASGVSVVNIDNGFGAGFQASLINQIGENG